MACIEILDKGIKGKERFKVTYDIRSWNDKRHRRSKTFPVGTGIREVEKFKRKVEAEYEYGEVLDMSKRKFSDFAEEYFENYTSMLSPTTVANYKLMYTNSKHGLKKVFGHMELSKIQSLTIQKYVNEMQKSGVSSKTIHNYVMLLHTMLKKAIRLHYIPQNFNPVEEVDLPRVKKGKVEAYTEEELQTLIDIFNKCEDKLLSASIKIIIGTGIRRSEACGLKIENFSKENKEITITESIVYAGRKSVSKAPKTDAGNRTISLPDSVVDVIEERIREYNYNRLKYGKDFQDNGYILCNPDGSIFTPPALSHRYKKYMEKNSDKIRYLSLHKLRHTFASIAIANHSDIKALQETLGHSDAMTTLNTYSHAYRKAKETQAQMLDDNIFKKVVSRSCQRPSRLKASSS